MDSDNYPITLCLLSSQEPPKAYNVLRTFHSPSETISPVGIGFCCVVLHNSPIRYASWAKHNQRLDDEYTCGRLHRPSDHYFGYGLWAIGYGLEYAVCRYPCLSPLTFRLIVSCLIASSPLISNLIPCLGSVLTQMPQADVEAVRSSASQNLHTRP